MEVKITKRTLLKEVCNDMCHNWYWHIQGRIYNDDGTRFRKFGFVEWFDAFDVQDYSEDGTHSRENVMEFLNECIACRLDLVRSYDDCAEFFNMCRETIRKWNEQ